MNGYFPVEMPEKCSGCFQRYATCTLWMGFDDWWDDRHPDCPLLTAEQVREREGKDDVSNT